MDKLWILLVTLVLLATPSTFLADGRNRSALKLVLENAASERPLTAGVRFRVPFAPEAPAPRAIKGPYPQSFVWHDDAQLKYLSLGGDYWQTYPINLNDGREITEEEDEWQAHLRFKSNPPGDPLHPGHALIAIDSPQHTISFAPLGPVDFDAVETIPEDRWLKPLENERSAVWGLEAGDVVGILIDSDPYGGFKLATDSVRKRYRYIAKLRIRKLSHDNVRYDYVYRKDGAAGFPRRDRSVD